MLKGPFGVILTPFDENGKVDYGAYEKELSFLLDSDIDGFFVCGTTGEFASLSPDENKYMLKFAAGFFSGRKKLLAGASSPNYKTTVEYMECAADNGYAAAVVCPPYYFTMDGNDTTRYYEKLTSENICDIVLYRIPMFTNTIEFSSFERLLSCDRIIAMKDSSANLKQIAHEIDTAKRLRPDFSILSGTDDCLVASLTCGCSGSMTAFSAILPEINAKIYKLFNEGKIIEANELNRKYLRLLRLADSVMFPSGYKQIFRQRGFDMGSCQAENKEALKKLCPLIDAELKELGVIK